MRNKLFYLNLIKIDAAAMAVYCTRILLYSYSKIKTPFYYYMFSRKVKWPEGHVLFKYELPSSVDFLLIRSK